MAGISANQRAWLDTIRMAEGTWHGGGEKGYGTMFGGGQFDWRQGHPDRVVRSGGYASAAAGAYQFMPATWAGVTKQMGVDPRDFSPAAQDRAALQLMRNRGVDPDQPISDKALAQLAPEWASLPTTSGKSYYGQPVKGHAELKSFYQGRLGATPTTASSGAAPAPSGGGDGSAEALALLQLGGQTASLNTAALAALGGNGSQAKLVAMSQMNDAFQARHAELMKPLPSLEETLGPRRDRKAGQRLMAFASSLMAEG